MCRWRGIRRAATTAVLLVLMGPPARPPASGQGPEAEASRSVVVQVTRLAGARGPIEIMVSGASGERARVSVPDGADAAEIRVGHTETALSCAGESVWCPDIAIPIPAPAAISLPVYPRAVLRGTWAAPGRDRPELNLLAVIQAPRPFASEPALRFSRSVVPGPDGRFSVDGPQGRLDLRLSADGCAPVYRFDVIVRDALSLGRVRCVPGGSVAGRIRDASSGLVAPGCSVILRQLAPVPARVTERKREGLALPRTVTDTNGFFQFRGLAPGRYLLEAESRRHASGGREVDVQAGAEVYVDDVWLSPYRPLAVSVTPPRTPDGTRWIVAVRPRSARLQQDLERWLQMPVDDAGTARFPRVATGEHELEIRTRDGEVVYRAMETVPEGAENLDVALDLVTVEGRVRRGSVALAGARVILSSGDADERTFVTDEAGRFEGWMQRPADAVCLDVAAGAWTVRSMVVQPEVVAIDRLRLEVTLGASALRIHVVDQHGAPVAGVWVHVEGEGPPATGTTGEDGIVEMEGLDEGRYHVHALSREHGTSDRLSVELARETTLDVTLVLAENRDLALHLMSFEGSPVPGADVSIYTPDGFDRRRTDSSGRAVLRVTRRSTFGVVRVYARSHMLWSGCRELPAGGPLLVRLPPALTGTLRIEAASAPGMGLALVTEAGGLLDPPALAAWRAALGYAPPHLGLDTPGVAAGFYRLVWWPSHDQAGLVTLACSGSLPPDTVGGHLRPGETLVLAPRPPGAEYAALVPAPPPGSAEAPPEPETPERWCRRLRGMGPLRPSRCDVARGLPIRVLFSCR
jgi:hypothetical protein